jgi:hypothetical protein
MRLKSRERQIPGGLSFYIPQIPGWRPAPWSSVTSLAEQVLAVRQGNPALVAKHGWSLNIQQIENEVDEFNANRCASLGHTSFITNPAGAAPPPSFSKPSQSDLSQLSAVAAKAKLVWQGLRTLGDWLDSGSPAVAQELADARGATCAACPINGKGDVTSWFAAPAAAAIKRQVEKLKARSLTTSSDDKLGVCEACLCPLPLKVHVPIEVIKNHTSDATLDKLRAAPACWVVKEIAAS